MSSVQIVAYRPDMATDVSLMLARAFASNPVHLAAFGHNPLAKNEVFFRTALPLLQGPRFVARDGTQLVGYVHWVDSSECQVAGFDKVRLFPTMLAGLGPRSALKVLFWLSTWERHDPRASHVHLGPIGVTPGAQGQGIGSRLMTRYCEALATAGEPGYLETDRLENVVFYRRFGFETTEEIPVIGVTNYFMSRPAAEVRRAHVA